MDTMESLILRDLSLVLLVFKDKVFLLSNLYDIMKRFLLPE